MKKIKNSLPVALELTVNDPIYKGAKSYLLISTRPKVSVTFLIKCDTEIRPIEADEDLPYVPSIKILSQKKAAALKELVLLDSRESKQESEMEQKRQAIEKKLKE